MIIIFLRPIRSESPATTGSETSCPCTHARCPSHGGTCGNQSLQVPVRGTVLAGGGGRRAALGSTAQSPTLTEPTLVALFTRLIIRA
jgi:hypothetical protein